MNFSDLDLSKLVAVLLACYLTGFLGSILIQDSVNNWYPTIDKPWFNPPSWVFMPVWTILYTFLGITGYWAWQKDISNLVPLILTLILHLVWNFVFFTTQNTLGGLATIVLVLGVGVYMTWKYKDIKFESVYLLIPYLLWIFFATLLNASIFLLN